MEGGAAELKRGDLEAGAASGFCWVCILVFTTSKGHVMTPAIPPAVAAVAISRLKPMSR